MPNPPTLPELIALIAAARQRVQATATALNHGPSRHRRLGFRWQEIQNEMENLQTALEAEGG